MGLALLNANTALRIRLIYLIWSSGRREQQQISLLSSLLTSIRLPLPPRKTREQRVGLCSRDGSSSWKLTIFSLTLFVLLVMPVGWGSTCAGSAAVSVQDKLNTCYGVPSCTGSQTRSLETVMMFACTSNKTGYFKKPDDNWDPKVHVKIVSDAWRVWAGYSNKKGEKGLTLKESQWDSALGQCSFSLLKRFHEKIPP